MINNLTNVFSFWLQQLKQACVENKRIPCEDLKAFQFLFYKKEIIYDRYCNCLKRIDNKIWWNLWVLSATTPLKQQLQ